MTAGAVVVHTPLAVFGCAQLHAAMHHRAKFIDFYVYRVGIKVFSALISCNFYVDDLLRILDSARFGGDIQVRVLGAPVGCNDETVAFEGGRIKIAVIRIAADNRKGIGGRGAGSGFGAGDADSQRHAVAGFDVGG